MLANKGDDSVNSHTELTGTSVYTLSDGSLLAAFSRRSLKPLLSTPISSKSYNNIIKSWLDQLYTLSA